MSEIIWAINPQNETLENLVFYLREQTNTYFESLNISYSIDLPDDVPSVKLTTFSGEIFSWSRRNQLTMP
ncbi:MAG: hypothetical protein WDN75_02910 [Bacteroidota bacterium]